MKLTLEQARETYYRKWQETKVGWIVLWLLIPITVLVVLSLIRDWL